MNSLTMKSLLRLVVLHALITRNGLPNNQNQWNDVINGLQLAQDKLYPSLLPGKSDEPR